MLKSLNGSLIYNKVLNTYDVLSYLALSLSSVISCIFLLGLQHISHFIQPLRFQNKWGASRGGSQFAIFLKHMLCMLFWEKILWIPKCNINIGDLCIMTLCLAFIKDDLLISKLFHMQQVVCPVWLIQSGVNSRWINSLASGFGPAAKMPREALASRITCLF